MPVKRGANTPAGEDTDGHKFRGSVEDTGDAIEDTDGHAACSKHIKPADEAIEDTEGHKKHFR